MYDIGRCTSYRQDRLDRGAIFGEGLDHGKHRRPDLPRETYGNGPGEIETQAGRRSPLRELNSRPVYHRCVATHMFWQGGVTPSIGDIEGAVLAVKGSRTKVHVLIRPRPGDFVYSSLEKQVTPRRHEGLRVDVLRVTACRELENLGAATAAAVSRRTDVVVRVEVSNPLRAQKCSCTSRRTPCRDTATVWRGQGYSYRGKAKESPAVA